MRKRIRVSWDASDLFLLSDSLDYLDSNPKVRAAYKKAARLPLMILGAPGGWALYPTLLFYAALASVFVLHWLGGSFAQLTMLPLLLMVTISSYAFGTVRGTKHSIIRLQILRILRARPDSWMKFVVDPARTYLESLAGYRPAPGRIRDYLNKMRALNGIDNFFTRYNTFATALTLGTGTAFLFLKGMLLALAFLMSSVAWIMMIPVSFFVSALADTTRNEIPKVWHAEDVRVLTKSQDEGTTWTSSFAQRVGSRYNRGLAFSYRLSDFAENLVVPWCLEEVANHDDISACGSYHTGFAC
jgi:hypothetical protein